MPPDPVHRAAVLASPRSMKQAASSRRSWASGLVLLVAFASRVALADAAAPGLAGEDGGFAYLRLGYAVRPTRLPGGSPGLALGGRLEHGHLGVDASVLNLYADDEAGGEGFSGAIFRLTGLYLLSPMRPRSAYAGGGLELVASRGVLESGRHYTGEGAHATAFAGCELLRAGNFKLFVEADGIVPLYKLRAQDGAVDGRTHLWLVFTVGVGFGPSRS
jgi:hypothetical protein